MELTSFLLYGEQLEQIQTLNMQQRGLLLTALMEAACGDMPKQGEMDPVVYVAFSFIWAQVQRDKKKFAETSAARSAAGAAGAESRWQKVAKTGKAKQAVAKRDKAKQGMASDGKASQAMANDGNASESMAEDGKTSQDMANDGNAWQTMANDGNASQKWQNETETETESVKRESKKRKPAAPAAVALLPDLDDVEAERLNEAWQSFAEMRKKIRAPLTEAAARLIVSDLKKHATVSGVFDTDLAVRILDQSTSRSWRGVFPLKADTSPAAASVSAAAKPANGFHNFDQRHYDFDALMAAERKQEAGRLDIPDG